METNREPLIMLVDDNEIDLLVNRKFLGVAGISDNVISFQSSIEALRYIDKNAEHPELLPKLILLDLQMPVVNGFAFLEEFEKHAEKIQDHCKIIILSSTVDPTDIERVNNSKNVVRVLSKPLNVGVFRDIIAKVA